MAQHDYNIVNGPGQTVRNDINAVLDAILSHNSGTQEPPVKFPGTLWFDISASPGVLKIWLDDGKWHTITAGANYLPLTGGNIVGDLTVNGTFTNPGFDGRRANYMSGVAPASPLPGMLWYDTAANPDTLKVFSGSPGAWQTLVNTVSPVFTQMVNIEAAGPYAILNLQAGSENRRIYNDAANDRLVFDGPAGATMLIADSGDVWIASLGWIGAALNGKQAAFPTGFTPVQQIGAPVITIGYSPAQLWIDGVSQGEIRLGQSVKIFNQGTSVGIYSRCTSINPTIPGGATVSGGSLRLGLDDSNTYPTGTWRNMAGSISDKGTSFFQRIA